MLLKKKVEFVWTEEQQKSFDCVKSLLTSPLWVRAFNTKLRTEFITDASRLHGLGFALVQYEPNSITPQIVQCGSRTLSDCETRYSTVELEQAG